MVAADPEIGEETIHLRLSAKEIMLDKMHHEVSGSALLFVPRYTTYSYGDVLLVTGKLETPRQLDDFDYKDYLTHQGIYSTMLYPGVEILERGKGLKPLEWIYSLRNRFAQTIAKVLPEPQASLAQGILLGMRGNIPQETNTSFARTGTAHLLAISGLHLSIVAGILLSLGVWLFGRRHYIYIWLALGTIWLYALLTGMHPPIIRGAIMASLFLTAELLGRQRSAITSLSLAAAIMVGISPYVLWDASFQMSFLAMAGLIFLAPPLQAIARKTANVALGEKRAAAPAANFIVDALSASLGATIAIWPVIAHYFGIISLVAPLATLLALPALPGIIVTSALAGITGLIALPLAQVMGWLAWPLLSYMLLEVNGFAASPLSSIEAGSFNTTTLIWVYYPVLIIVFWLSRYRKKLTDLMPKIIAWLGSRAGEYLNLVARLPRKWTIPPLMVLAILASFTAASMPDDSLHISILDVGQGDAILVQKGAQQVLIDGGPSPHAICLGLGSKMPFWDRTIDLVVLTHPHDDHIAGLVEVLQRYKVEQVLYPDIEFESDIYDEWLWLLQEKDIECIIARAGQQINLGEEVVMEVLNPQDPPLNGTSSDIDNNGVVLHIIIGEVRFLFAADIMREAEIELFCQRSNLKSTVLKVAHHGSDTSTSEEFLSVADPQIAVISAGAKNAFEHPSEKVMSKLEQRLGPENVYCTDEHGTIEFTTDGKRLWVKTES